MVNAKADRQNREAREDARRNEGKKGKDRQRRRIDSRTGAPEQAGEGAMRGR
jgi:hypothetical protein